MRPGSRLAGEHASSQQCTIPQVQRTPAHAFHHGSGQTNEASGSAMLCARGPRPFLVIPDTYQVILLAFGRVLGVPLLLPVSLLKIVAAAAVVATGVGASPPASPSGSKLLWHKRGKGTKKCVRSGEKPFPAFCSNTSSGTGQTGVL